MALLAALAVGLSVRTLTRSVPAALWSAAALLCIPLWLGMGFFNIKDVPVATGYTLVTTGLVIGVASDRRPTAGAVILVSGLVGFGSFLAVGTRIAMWAPVAASIGLCVLTLVLRRRWTNEGGWLRLSSVLVGAALSFLALALLYPEVFTHPFAAMVESLRDSSSYPWEGVTLTAGSLLGEYPPWWYLPALVLASVPTLFLVAGILGAVTAITGARRNLGSGIRQVLVGPTPGIGFVLLQLMLLPLLSIAAGSNMYTGLRQHLYVLPAIVIMAGVGANWLLGQILWPRWTRFAIPVLLIVALVIPMIGQVQLFPYNYTYVSAVASLNGINGQWESDYWESSLREAIEKVPEGETPVCGSLIPKDQPADSLTLYRTCDPSVIGPYRKSQGSFPTDRDGRGTWVIAARRAGNKPPDYCRIEDEVTRELRFTRVVMAYVLKCDSRRVSELTID
ncbi:MAG: hypothetical protein KDM81_15975, partial [Verrucomicrobiae bacterium]|nr:hypothetical protein [Verrucomicrobiae bacterium]